jgi:hypothetical protein
VRTKPPRPSATSPSPMVTPMRSVMTVSRSLPSQYPTGPPTLPRAVSAKAAHGPLGVVHPVGVLRASLRCPGAHGKKVWACFFTAQQRVMRPKGCKASRGSHPAVSAPPSMPTARPRPGKRGGPTGPRRAASPVAGPAAGGSAGLPAPRATPNRLSSRLPSRPGDAWGLPRRREGLRSGLAPPGAQRDTGCGAAMSVSSVCLLVSGCSSVTQGARRKRERRARRGNAQGSMPPTPAHTSLSTSMTGRRAGWSTPPPGEPVGPRPKTPRPSAISPSPSVMATSSVRSVSIALSSIDHTGASTLRRAVCSRALHGPPPHFPAARPAAVASGPPCWPSPLPSCGACPGRDGSRGAVLRAAPAGLPRTLGAPPAPWARRDRWRGALGRARGARSPGAGAKKGFCFSYPRIS